MNKNQRKLNKIASIFGLQPKQVPKKSNALPEDNVPAFFKEKVKFYDKYSDDLKGYIQRCFVQCDNDDEKTYVSNQLVQKIADASIRGTLLSHDWQNEKTITSIKSKAQISSGWAHLVKPTETLAFKSSTILKSNEDQQAKEGKDNTPFKASISPAQKLLSVNKFEILKDTDDSDNNTQENVNPTVNKAKKSKKEKLLEKQAKAAQNKQKNKNKSQEDEIQEVIDEIQLDIQEISSKKKKKDKKKNKKKQEEQKTENKSNKSNKSPLIESLLDMDLKTLSNNKIFKGLEKKNDNKTNTNLISNTQKSKPRDVTHSMSFEDLIEYNRIVGTSTALEKPYLRLTGEPDPENIRPHNILEKSLDFCLDKFRRTGDYQYIRDQMRSIRQDLTVQHIEDDFAVLVYETSLKLAIENFDWDNFNQCLTPLEQLYNEGLGKTENIAEIDGYKIIYLVRFQDSFDLYTFIPRLNLEILKSDSATFALKIWRAISGGDYVTYFRLYKTATPMMKNVLTTSLPSVRYEALLKAKKGFRNMTLNDYMDILCFETIDETKKYLDEKEVTYIQK
ncbi:SAC3/GANP family protein [Trichomonas vaginalis G3]|uniref:SAC3/GANP family protein n=1 Tax=Trichomonas vaginalis (strain ATCC PRA-98 / G3) TaxID=412133 RepID=A2EWR1_TRIV3|nr:transcription, DNA-templated [Trichomonas vaginalis G3]EAY02891.1 SAC3/GANP family protein [Trichomonas vaginalis G3]KAI5551256.1 transcription, DNA-templated [Trichomonas vaginalis G3]|eukprot:XP_001315114.1 SAC3/GANP family protein [Trichomonas vaginalis G3]